MCFKIIIFTAAAIYAKIVVHDVATDDSLLTLHIQLKFSTAHGVDKIPSLLLSDPH